MNDATSPSPDTRLQGDAALVRALGPFQLGASIINDVSGTLHQVAARLGVGYVGMHSTAVPVLAGDQPSYDDVLAEVSSQLVDIAALSKGAAELWIDPGIGFGKGVQDNLSLLRHLPELCSLGVPVLLGVSRKSFIGAVTGREVGDRLPASLALVAPAWAAGVDIIRVHDVPQTLDVITMLEAVWGR